MTSNWQGLTVSQLEAAGIILVQDGNHGEYRPRREELVADGTPHVRAADIGDDGTIDFDRAQRINEAARERIKKGRGMPGDILLTHKGTVGRVARVPADAPGFVCSPQTTFWRSLDGDQLDQAFLFAYLRSPAFAVQLRERMHDSDMAPYVSLTAQRALTVVLPPIAEQRRIGSVVSALEDLAHSNRRTASRLEETAAALFRARFVDFVGVEEFRDSELGPIPEGWTVDGVYDVATVRYGAPFRSALFSEADGVPLIRIRDLATGKPSVRTTEVRPDARLVRRGDVVVGMDGEFRAHVWNGPDSWLNQRVCCFEPLLGVSRVFVLESIKKPLAFFEATKGGTTVIHLGKRDIDAFRLVRPDDESMAEFTRQADPLLGMAVALRSEVQTLAEICDRLLPALISGRVRVSATDDVRQVVDQTDERLAQGAV
jgi:type I restriction enzyme, S subunit